MRKGKIMARKNGNRYWTVKEVDRSDSEANQESRATIFPEIERKRKHNDARYRRMRKSGHAPVGLDYWQSA